MPEERFYAWDEFILVLQGWLYILINKRTVIIISDDCCVWAFLAKLYGFNFHPLFSYDLLFLCQGFLLCYWGVWNHRNFQRPSQWQSKGLAVFPCECKYPTKVMYTVRHFYLIFRWWNAVVFILSLTTLFVLMTYLVKVF